MKYEYDCDIVLKNLLEEEPEYKDYDLFFWEDDELWWCGNLSEDGIYEKYKDWVCSFISEYGKELWIYKEEE